CSQTEARSASDFGGRTLPTRAMLERCSRRKASGSTRKMPPTRVSGYAPPTYKDSSRMDSAQA
ncbi:MAG: hypothetical protein AVDCRST_MAG37-2948, partial [uncultured Rubrobacteraceae bacterium]